MYMKNKEYKSTGGVYEEEYQRSCTPTTTNMSKNDSFEKNGYLFIPGLISDPENLFDSPPVDENGKRITGQMNYVRKDKVNFIPDEKQVPGNDAAVAETARQEIRDKYADMQVAIDAAASADELKTILGIE